MKNSKVKIFVAVHKDAQVYNDEVYTPIHVGKAVSDCKMNFIGDDTGDNISAKNPYYCELTAQYWVWKNVSSEYVGFCHYRRYFSKIFTKDNIDVYLKHCDIILVKPIFWRCSLVNKLINELTLEDGYIFYKVLCKLYPSYKKTVDSYLLDNKDYAFNMFVCKKEVFDEYAEWQFHILSECEKYIRLSEYTRLKRIYGYLGEFLLPIWVIYNKKKISTMPISVWPGGERVFSHFSNLKGLIYRLVLRVAGRARKKSIDFGAAVILGITQDKINI